MTRTNTILLILLLVQGAILGVQTFAAPEAVDASARGLLLDGLSADAVEQLVIDEGGDAEDVGVTLKKTGSGWVVSDRWDHPADGAKVDELIRELAALEVADVVSQTGLHDVELGVADDDFRKKVTLTGGGERTLYLGTSGRGSSTHTRVAGEQRVVAVRDFSTWRVNARADSWVQRTVVDVDPEAVTELTLAGAEGTVTLRKDGEAWLVNDGPANADEVDKLIKKAAKVTLSKVVGPASGTPEGAVLTVTVTTPERATTWRIAPSTEDGKFLVAVDGGAHLVEVGKWAVEPLIDATAESLAGAIPMEAPEAPQE